MGYNMRKYLRAIAAASITVAEDEKGWAAVNDAQANLSALALEGLTNVKVYTCSFAEWAGLGNKVEK